MNAGLLRRHYILSNVDGNPGGAPAADATPVSPEPAPAATPADDLAALFTPEDIAAKKESIAAAQAEEARRAALTEEQRAEEDAAKEAAAKSDTVPDEYAEFTLPEGMEMDKGLLNEALPMFKDIGLSQAKAQQVIDLYANKIAPALVKSQMDQWAAITEGWKTELAATKEVTLDDKGQNLDGQRVINTLFKPEEAQALRDDLDKYGFGNHPGLNLMFARMSKYLKEDTFVDGKPVANKDGKPIAQQFYPNMNP
jgi:hypothetical protein